MPKQIAAKRQKREKQQYDPEKAPFSWDKLDGLLAYKATLIVCSDILEVSDTTIKNHIQARYGMSFTEYADKKLSRTKVKLVQKAIERAVGGNTTMLIFCLKNICKWKDNHEEDEQLKNITVVYPDGRAKKL